MRNYALKVMRELEFDKEAIDALYADLEAIYNDENAKKEFEECIRAYEENINLD